MGDVTPWVFHADTEGTYTVVIDKRDSADPSRTKSAYQLTLVVKPHWKQATVDDSTKNNRIKEGGMYSSLAIGNDGTPHISYYSPDYGAVRYATRHNDAWDSTTVAGSRGTLRTSIALNPKNGYPEFTYSDSNSCIGDLMSAYWDGSEWKTLYVARPETGAYCHQAGLESSMKWDHNVPQIAYTTGRYPYGILFAYGNAGRARDWNIGGGWLYPAWGPLHDPSLAIRADGKHFVAYREGNEHGNLVLAERD